MKSTKYCENYQLLETKVDLTKNVHCKREKSPHNFFFMQFVRKVPKRVQLTLTYRMKTNQKFIVITQKILREIYLHYTTKSRRLFHVDFTKFLRWNSGSLTEKLCNFHIVSWYELWTFFSHAMFHSFFNSRMI